MRLTISMLDFSLDPHHITTARITQHHSGQPSKASGSLPLSLWLIVNQTTSCRSRTPNTFEHEIGYTS